MKMDNVCCVLCLLLVPVVSATYNHNHERRLLDYLFKYKTDESSLPYNSAQRPMENSSDIVPLDLAGTLYQVIDLDEKNQILTSTLWLDLTWRDDWFIWDPSRYGGIKDIRLPPAAVWMPDLLLYNSANQNFDATFPTNVLVYSHGKMNQIPPGIFKSTCPVDMIYFPFDTQRCNLTFGTWSFNGRYINLRNTSSKVGLGSFTNNSEFHLVSANIFRETYKDPCCEGDFITITFELVLQRRTVYYFANLIMPCLLIASMAIMGFYFPPASGEKLTLEITVLMSLTFYNDIVSSMQPPSSDTPLISVYFTSIMALVASSVVCTILILNSHHRHADSVAMPHWVACIFLQWLPWLLQMSPPVNKQSNAPQKKPQNVRYPSSLLESMGEDYIAGGIANICHPLSSTSRTIAWINHHLYSTVGSSQKERRPTISQIEKELGDIRQEVTTITNKIQEDARDYSVELDWKFAGRVLDRLCLVVSASFTLALSAAVLITAPKVIVV